jgi:hypothetical protein
MMREGEITDGVLGKTDLSRTVIVLISGEKQNCAGFLTGIRGNTSSQVLCADLTLTFGIPDVGSAARIVGACLEEISSECGIKLSYSDAACRLIAENAGYGASAKKIRETTEDILSGRLSLQSTRAADISADGNNIVVTSLKALDKSQSAEYN